MNYINGIIVQMHWYHNDLKRWLIDLHNKSNGTSHNELIQTIFTTRIPFLQHYQTVGEIQYIIHNLSLIEEISSIETLWRRTITYSYHYSRIEVHDKILVRLKLNKDQNSIENSLAVVDDLREFDGRETERPKCFK